MTSPTRYSTSPAPWVPGALLHKGDCLKVLRNLPDASVSCVVTDPPYGLSDVSSAEVIQAITAWAGGDRERVPDGKGFMGNEWDRFVPPPAVWDECLRVLKPGGYMTVFAGSRTADLMGLSIRLAGFEMRDTINWCYGSGFPKSLDVGKAIDKAAGAVREVVGPNRWAGRESVHDLGVINDDSWSPTGAVRMKTAPTTQEAQKWDGWGTALKPASEPIIVARKPFPGTVASNVLTHGTGGMNIDGCRVAADGRPLRIAHGTNTPGKATYGDNGPGGGSHAAGITDQGRWPANLVLSHSEYCDAECAEGCPVAELDRQSLANGIHSAGATCDTKRGAANNSMFQLGSGTRRLGDSGGASRFFPVFQYQAKAPKSERPVVNGVAHPTVKPLALMEWLVTLFTPLYGVVLDPFTGSGTTGQAALKLGFNSIIIERDAKYWPLIDARLSRYLNSLKVGA